MSLAGSPAIRATAVRAILRSIVGAGIVTLTFSATPAVAATLPPRFTEALVAGGLTNPTAMAFAPDGRLFVCQQGGQLRVIANGALLPTPFVTLVVNSDGERGLLGVAFDPAFSVNHYVYVYYTATSPAIHNRVSRWTANGDVADPGSEHVLLDLNNLSSATNHNGGAIHFAGDGTLFIAVGENATGSNAQSLGNLLGKILRINADGTIPTDNPFYTQATGVNRAIWALGLRNPYTFAFQPVTGRMFINDVGENTYEEINDGIAGSNYGWPNSEGPTANPNERGPLYYYGHGTGPFLGCAIAGGTFYNPSTNQFPSGYAGKYFFADFCGGWMNRFNSANAGVATFASGISFPVDLHVGPEGSLYYLARGAGSVYRISYAGFTDDPLIAGTSMIRAVHITELRTSINALRARFGLPPFVWTDPSLGAGTSVKAVHIAQLRTALLQAYGMAGQPAPTFTDDPLIAQTTVIRVLHVTELRNAVLALETS
jgi:glucose/arabinose dehydrogenase